MMSYIRSLDTGITQIFLEYNLCEYSTLIAQGMQLFGFEYVPHSVHTKVFTACQTLLILCARSGDFKSAGHGFPAAVTKIKADLSSAWLTTLNGCYNVWSHSSLRSVTLQQL